MGDDLAVNAEKATGFVSSRELPVIWSITKGSFINKLIILPHIILLSAYFPKAIIPILLIGGLYLAYEGAEKIFEYLFPEAHHPKESLDEMKEMTVEEILKKEKEKVRSAILTDFILSLEIIIISLSTVTNQPLTVQIFVLIIIAIATTLGVYGIVALIVRMDDMGYHLITRSKRRDNKVLGWLGLSLVKSLPWVIKGLAVLGTLAMLLVAGGIYVHNIHKLHEFLHSIPLFVSEILVGLVLGFAVFGIVKIILFVKSKF